MEHSNPKATDQDELCKLVAKGLGSVLRFTTDSQMRLECFKVLNVTNSSDAEKAIFQRLTNQKEIEPMEVTKKMKSNTKKRKFYFLLEEARNDLDNWD